MREICLSGSEGGGAEPNRPSLPLSKRLCRSGVPLPRQMSESVSGSESVSSPVIENRFWGWNPVGRCRFR